MNNDGDTCVCTANGSEYDIKTIELVSAVGEEYKKQAATDYSSLTAMFEKVAIERNTDIAEVCYAFMVYMAEERNKNVAENETISLLDTAGEQWRNLYWNSLKRGKDYFEAHCALACHIR